VARRATLALGSELPGAAPASRLICINAASKTFFKNGPSVTRLVWAITTIDNLLITQG
jgi:hypothetical protein